MPLNINNVDVSVNANILFGLNSYLLTADKEEAQTNFDDDL